MRANNFPTAEEMDGDPDKHSKVLITISLLAEYLTGTPVRERRKEELLLLGLGDTYLREWPAYELQIPGIEKGYAFLDSEKGLLSHELPLSEYSVSYRVGFKEGQVPAVIKALLTSLGRYYLTKDQSLIPEIEDLVRVCRRMRREGEQSRVS